MAAVTSLFLVAFESVESPLVEGLALRLCRALLLLAPIQSCEGFEQLRCHFLNAGRGFEHLGVGKGAAAASGGKVGDARERTDANAILPGNNRFRHRAHADRIRT